MENIDDMVYSREVIEFTAVANEYCNLLEKSSELTGIQILKIMQRLLPLLYIKSVSLPPVEPINEEELEKFVSEDDWNRLHTIVISRLGEANDYQEVISESPINNGEEFCGSISENLSDIYQDLKDFLVRYRIGTIEIMNDSIWEINESFRLYWGQKLVNTLRAVHNALLEPDRIGIRKDEQAFDPGNIDTSDWIITKRQDNLGDEKE
ncbi:MAG TPA: DUF5063 domain-containing protein [Bacteroidales bacterium]|nr:DUF5063 domain-containing protein [Bacteroidales bacterium]